MADIMKDNYVSHHFQNHHKATPAIMEDQCLSAKNPAFTSTEKPISTRPMSGARKFAAFLITLSHLFSIWALYDMFFILDLSQGLKWFVASFVFYYFTGVQGITAGAHRLWAHRSYTANLPTRIWLMLMNSIANEGPIIQWSLEHRIHHIHVDTDADPHNINRGFFYAHMGWLYSARTDAFAKAKKDLDISDLKADPVVMWQQRNYEWFGPFMCYLLPTILCWLYAGDAWRGFLYLGHLRWVITLNLSWCVNSVSHTFGVKPYSEQMARDNLFTSLFSGGEGWHNYHHTFPYDYAACEQTSLWQFNDPSGVDWRFNAARFWIDLYAALGGVSNRKVHRNNSGHPIQRPIDCTVTAAPHMRDELLKVD